MSLIDEFVLHDVRCFHGEQRARLRPITLLVGENSTGKTTFLGCYSVLHQLLAESWLRGAPVDFNREPFSMGSFRDIARARRGPDGRIEEFRLGFKVVPIPSLGTPYDLLVTFAEEGSQPVVTSVHHDFGAQSFLSMERQSGDSTILKIPDGQVAMDIPVDNWKFILEHLGHPEREGFLRDFGELRFVSDYLMGLPGWQNRRSIREIWSPNMHRSVAVAPLRSKPKRTYDPVRETASADGEHIPMLMMRLDRTDKGGWSSLHDDLTESGREAGLFADIKVRSHGRQMSDPFQLQVKVRSGSYVNIMDVGYGVSQSLPILVDVRRAKRCVFLLQQPEVHLHPVAQAGLAELFVESYRKHRNRFLIETHSDYIVDRIRILVRNGVLRAQDVSILYFEPTRNAATIHSITLDRDGNLEGTPERYRDFFLKETDRLLGFE